MTRALLWIAAGCAGFFALCAAAISERHLARGDRRLEVRWFLAGCAMMIFALACAGAA